MFRRGLAVLSLVLGGGILVAGLIGQLSPVLGPLVPLAEGVLFMVLLVWVHWQYESQRTDSPFYQQHLANIQGFARSAREAGFFLPDNRGNLWAATRPVDIATPSASDFFAHYPDAAPSLEEWNRVANRYNSEVGRFPGYCHTASERITGQVNNSLAMLLQKLGTGEVNLANVRWRLNEGRLEASWENDVDGVPAYVVIVPSGAAPTHETLERVKHSVVDFVAEPTVEERKRIEGEHSREVRRKSVRNLTPLFET